MPELNGVRLNALARSKGAKALGAIAFVVAVWFMFDRASGSWAEIGSAISRARPGLVAASVCFVLLAELVFAINWHWLLSGLGEGITFKRSFKAYALAGLARFLPGAVMAHIGRAGLAVRYGARPRPATVSTAAETVLSALAALAFGLVGSTQLLEERFEAGERTLLSAALIALTVAVAPSGLAWISSQTERISRGRILVTMVVYLAAWLCLGLSLFTLSSAFASPETTLPSPLAATGGIAIAWLAGLAAVVVPGGLGIREAAIVTLLTGPLGAAASVVVAVAHRLVWLLVTVVLFAVGSVVPLRPDATDSTQPISEEHSE